MLLYNPAGHAGVIVSAGAGAEHFSWREFDSSGQRILEEAGYRAVFRFHLDQVRDDRFFVGYSGKIYGGTVNYDGETLAVPPVPVMTNTRYLGIQNEALIGRQYSLSSGLQIFWRTGLGWDIWRRAIRNSALNSDQIEDYQIFYLKLGPGVNLPLMRNHFFSIDFGGKFPFYSLENAHLNTMGFDQNPGLHPGIRGSFYLNAGYRINSNLEIMALYDTYRFVQSQPVAVSTSGVSYLVVQPESWMDSIGIQIRYRLP